MFLLQLDVTKNLFKNAVVVGCGSIGSKHAKYLFTCADSVSIVDPLIKNLSTIKINKHYHDIWELDNASSSEDLAVVANWGPDHYNTITTLIDKGYQNFVFEKPIVCSLQELYEIEKLSKNTSIRVVVNQGWHYEFIADRVNDLAKKLGLGDPKAIWITGGARCMSTAGSHYIHLARNLLKSDPLQVMALLDQEKINPRSADLEYIDGVIAIKMESNARVSLSYSNKSSIEGEFQILWRDAHGYIDDKNIKIIRRSIVRPYADIVTRYGKPNEVVFDGEIPSLNSDSLTQLESLYMALKNYSYTELITAFNSHILTTKTLLYALISNSLARSVDLNENFNEDLYQKRFAIS